jgi:hypothetical protein
LNAYSFAGSYGAARRSADFITGAPTAAKFLLPTLSALLN